ncbi:ESCRT-III subunit protein did4 [Blastocladiella emersonii ATCC 22665]|nr:ESCRT-III subunit protein did4 [Blastocladiella emersonii ATCC 22665]
MDFLFGQRKTPAEMLRQHQRALQRAMRDLDRERMKLEQQEKKLVADIKKTARAGQMGACKVMAKDLVRTRRYVQKFYNMRTQLQAVSLRIQTLQSNTAMAEAMRGVTKAMRGMNRQINLPQITKIMMEFEKEAEMMDMKEEMMNDAIDDVMEDADDEEEEEEIVMKVLDEIGIDLDQKFAEAPKTSLGAASKVSAPAGRVALAEGAGGASSSSGGGGGAGGSSGGAMDDDAALQARLEQLRRGD